MRERVLIWGASGHAKVLAEILMITGFEIAGYLDDVHPERKGQEFFAGAIQGGSEELAALRASGISRAMVGFGDNQRRITAGETLEKHGFELCRAIHPAAVVSPSVTIGAGTMIAAGSVINASTSIGRHAIINTRAGVDHDCVIGDGAHVGPGVSLGGSVKVGRGAWIGIGATVIHDIQIGERAMAGAGAVVVDDVPADVLVVGVPARIARSLVCRA